MEFVDKHVNLAKRLLNERWARLRFNSAPYIDPLKGKSGIEIGGPSLLFSSNNLLPVYKVAGSLDNCNFSNSTLWESSLQEGLHFSFGKKKGYQYIREASELKGIENDKYDFLISSHCLEHCANAIKTLREWIRVVKPQGYLLIVVPDKTKTFDHRRPLTTLSHFIQDEQKDTGEDDLSHLDEIVKLHDLKKDKKAGTLDNFIQRSQKNIENRGLHHHTFSIENLTELSQHLGLKVLKTGKEYPFHIFLLAQKP